MLQERMLQMSNLTWSQPSILVYFSIVFSERELMFTSLFAVARPSVVCLSVCRL